MGVLVDNLRDNKYFNKEIEVIRNGKKIKLLQKVLRKGDKFETDSEHAKYLEKKGLVVIQKKESKEVE